MWKKKKQIKHLDWVDQDNDKRSNKIAAYITKITCAAKHEIKYLDKMVDGAKQITTNAGMVW